MSGTRMVSNITTGGHEFRRQPSMPASSKAATSVIQDLDLIESKNEVTFSDDRTGDGSGSRSNRVSKRGAGFQEPSIHGSIPEVQEKHPPMVFRESLDPETKNFPANDLPYNLPYQKMSAEHVPRPKTTTGQDMNNRRLHQLSSPNFNINQIQEFVSKRKSGMCISQHEVPGPEHRLSEHKRKNSVPEYSRIREGGGILARQSP